MEDVNSIVIAAAIAAGLIGWIAIAMRFRFLMVVLGTMIFAASIAVTRSAEGRVLGHWLYPLQAMRAELFLGGGILTLMGLLLHAKSASIRRTSGQAWMLLLITWFAGILRIYHGAPYEGFRTIVGTVFTVLPLTLAIPMLLRTRRDWYDLVRLFMWADLVWIGCVAVQFVISPAQLGMGWHNRFIGIGGNPQHAAMILTVFAAIALWLSLNDPKRRYRLLWIGLLAVNLIMLVGTGSRTGAGMFVLGAVAILYRRLGASVIVLPLGALCTWGVYELLVIAGLDFGFERVLSMEDTRSTAWLSLIEIGLEHPLLGAGGAEVEASENSFLWGFATYGTGLLALMLAFLFVSIAHCWNLMRAGRNLPQWQPLIDLMIGFNMMYFGGAMFEGIILLRSSVVLCGLLIIGSMSAVFLQMYRAGQIDEIEYDIDEMTYEERLEEEYDYPVEGELGYGEE